MDLQEPLQLPKLKGAGYQVYFPVEATGPAPWVGALLLKPNQGKGPPDEQHYLVLLGDRVQELLQRQPNPSQAFQDLQDQLSPLVDNRASFSPEAGVLLFSQNPQLQNLVEYLNLSPRLGRGPQWVGVRPLQREGQLEVFNRSLSEWASALTQPENL